MTLGLQHALDHEHHVGATRIIFVEHQGSSASAAPRGAGPSRNSVTCCPSRSTIASRPIEVDTADMRVEIDADRRPVEPRRDLLDMARFAGAVITLHHHPAIVRKAGADRERRIRIEHIGRIEIGHALVGFGESRHLHVRIDTEQIAHRFHLIGRVHHRIGAAVGLYVGQVHDRLGKAAGISSTRLEPPRSPRNADQATFSGRGKSVRKRSANARSPVTVNAPAVSSAASGTPP